MKKTLLISLATLFIAGILNFSCQKISDSPFIASSQNSSNLLADENDTAIYTSTNFGIQSFSARTGKAIWGLSAIQFNSQTFMNAPLIVQNSLFLAIGNQFYNYNKSTGTVKWQTVIDSSNTTTSVKPLVLENNILVGLVSSTNSFSKLVGVDTGTGRVLWVNKLGKRGQHASPVMVNGIVYTSDKNYLYAFNETNGNAIWRVKLSQVSYGDVISPCVVNGNLYTTAQSSTSDTLFSINASNGNINWRLALGGITAPLTSYPTYYKGSIFINGVGKIICADATTGIKKWESSGDTDIAYFDNTYNALAISQNVVTAGVDVNSYLCAFDVNTGKRIWRDQLAFSIVNNSYYSSSPVSLNNLVYIRGGGDVLQCNQIKDGSVKWQFPSTEANSWYSPVLTLNNQQSVYATESGMTQ